jgi:hypothetical protein
LQSLKRPTYSHDLTPCDYRLFPALKKKFGDNLKLSRCRNISDKMGDSTGDRFLLTGNKKLFPGKDKSVMMNELFGKLVA